MQNLASPAQLPRRNKIRLPLLLRQQPVRQPQPRAYEGEHDKAAPKNAVDGGVGDDIEGAAEDCEEDEGFLHCLESTSTYSRVGVYGNVTGTRLLPLVYVSSRCPLG